MRSLDCTICNWTPHKVSKHKAKPCFKGLHPMIERNMYHPKDGHPPVCRACGQKAQRDMYARDPVGQLARKKKNKAKYKKQKTKYTGTGP